MNKNVTQADLENTIKTMLLDRDPGVRIMGVKVEEDFDFDGDEILKVDIIFEGNPSDFKKLFLRGAIRSVINKLRECEIHEFPVLSYVSSRDAAARNDNIAACY